MALIDVEGASGDVRPLFMLFFLINDFCFRYMLKFSESFLIKAVQSFDYHMIQVIWQL
jgi:hypothetical protein